MNAQIAKLRSAYLLMFYYFGYEYIMQDSVKVVRQQILSPEQDLIASKAVIALGQDPDELNTISLIRTPSDLRCFLVTLKIPTEVDRSFGVMLPGLDRDGATIYDRLHDQRHALNGMQFRLTQFVPNPKAPIGYIHEGFVTWFWYNSK